MELPVTRVAVRKTTMASETDTDVQCVGKNIPRTKRKLQKHLRSAGLAYVSRTGKIIPAKKVADELCQCPQKCNERVSRTHRERLFTYFYHTLGDADSQNKFLRAHMDVRARVPPSRSQTPTLPGTRPPRRITCKYLIPLLPKTILIEDDETETLEICQKAFCSSFVISTKRVRLQREKLIHSLGLNSYHHQRHLKKRNNNNETVDPIFVVKYDEDTDVPEIEINTVHELKSEDIVVKDDASVEMMSSSYRKCLVDNPLIPLGISVPDGVTIAPVTATPDHDRDIAIVNNFFSNQLWKPEYIGAYS